MRLEVTQRFPVALRDGFDYIVDPDNWPAYWPDLIRVQPGSRWREPGDRAGVVMRLLGRPVELEMTLRVFDVYRLVEYDSVQRGLPDVRHERGFDPDGEGFEYRLAVEFEPRAGLRGAFDRRLVKRGVERALRRTLANLETQFGDRARCGSARRAAPPPTRRRPPR